MKPRRQKKAATPLVMHLVTHFCVLCVSLEGLRKKERECWFLSLLMGDNVNYCITSNSATPITSQFVLFLKQILF